jgi:hypothetical protein
VKRKRRGRKRGRGLRKVKIGNAIDFCSSSKHHIQVDKTQSHLSKGGPCDAIIVLESIVSVVGHLNMEWIRKNVILHHQHGRRNPQLRSKHINMVVASKR